MLIELLGTMIAGNATVTIARDRDGVYILRHATRGTFRADTLHEAIEKFLKHCGLM